MKRFFTLFLALVVIFSLCACDNSQLPNNGNQQIQGTDNQQPQNNDTPSNTKYKLTVIDYWGYLVKPLNEYYEAGEEVEVTLAFLSGPSVGIELNGEYIGETPYTIHDGVYPIITFTMPAKDSILYTTQNGHIGRSDKDEISDSSGTPGAFPSPETVGSEPPVQEAYDWGITLTLKNLTRTGATIVCTQSGGVPTGELQTGSFFILEKLTETGWKEVEHLPQERDVSWTSIAYLVNIDGTTEWTINWEWLYGELPDGHYRIGKPFDDFRGTANYDTMMIYATFGFGTPDD